MARTRASTSSELVICSPALRIGTYSIVARDRMSGDLGVAVHSHWFSVGSIVSWARAGVGAVATQSVAEPAYGPGMLERLAAGEPAPAALQGLFQAGAVGRLRQVAGVDAGGGTARTVAGGRAGARTSGRGRRRGRCDRRPHRSRLHSLRGSRDR